jgi:hypothetical protein
MDTGGISISHIDTLLEQWPTITTYQGARNWIAQAQAEVAALDGIIQATNQKIHVLEQQQWDEQSHEKKGFLSKFQKKEPTTTEADLVKNREYLTLLKDYSKQLRNHIEGIPTGEEQKEAIIEEHQAAIRELKIEKQLLNDEARKVKDEQKILSEAKPTGFEGVLSGNSFSPQGKSRLKHDKERLENQSAEDISILSEEGDQIDVKIAQHEQIIARFELFS